MTFFLTRWFYAMMQFLYGLTHNSYLWTIIISTVLLRLIQILPDISNRRTQIKMAKIQPKIDELQKRYQNDPQKLRLEQSKLMKENGVNTLTSCLPMLLTLPLFFCFFAAFRCWGNEETITLMYETVVSQNYEEGTAERAAAEDMAMDTFKNFKFLWVHNIWQPDCFIDAEALILRFDGTVITKPRNMSLLSSVTLANMPLLQKGYTNAAGEFVSGQKIWQTLSESGLAAGEWGNAGNTSGCNSCTMCATDRSGMLLLPDEISPEIAKKMIGVDTSVQTSDENGEMSGSKSTATVSDIYAAIMERYPNALTKDGKTPANGLMILPFLAAAMQLLSTLVTMKRQKKEGQSQQAKSMNTMMYIMPVISILICMSSTTAFAFYWTISGAFQLISTLVINAIFDKKAKKEVA